MVNVWKNLFYLGGFLLIYVYAGYPFLLFLFSKWPKKRLLHAANGYYPMVSLVVVARNEEKIIENKIANALSLDYPKDKLEIIFISDNSTDRTDAIIKKYRKAGIVHVVQKKRLGKTAAQNCAVTVAKGEILVFSDANAIYDKQAVAHLIIPFSDVKVGCVSGELKYLNPKRRQIGHNESVYWKYEKFIKELESATIGLLGANGSIYAVRKADYIFLENDAISDFLEPLLIAARGKRSLFVREAVSFENSSDSFSQEFRRKRRIIARSLRGLYRHVRILYPIKKPHIAFGVISHKLLRWLSPFFAIGFFTASYFLRSSSVYRTFFVLQGLFYSLAAIGAVLRKGRGRFGLVSIPLYFCLIWSASLLGIIDFISGKNYSVWDPHR
jgi:cellulose synthase/poly-beta-1,6-N-acetylglucosamine synthase-like glycosyltransferase